MERQTKLMEQLAAPENLLLAWRTVRGNIPKYRRTRSSGPDKVSLAEFERDLAAQLHALHDMLLSGRYQPIPPARFKLPKRGGGERQVCVLSVRDRVAQRAAQQVLEPLWEPEFLACSFGFRPALGTQDALSCVQQFRQQGAAWIVDGDIAACFDSLDHDILMARLKNKLSDRRVMRLLESWLDTGLIQAGLPEEGALHPEDMPQSAAAFFRRGLDWALDGTGQKLDPYAAARYEARLGDLEEDAAYLPEPIEGQADKAQHHYLRRQALQRMVGNGLMWGATWARPALEAAGKTARFTLASPAGRRLLQKGALATGGLAGAAAAAAVTAYVLHRKAGPAPAGVLQGSPLSPLLANIYLHPFDVSMLRAQHCLVRFADDWVVCCPSQESAEAAYNHALRCLARLRLRINPEKTHILSPQDKLEWLGGIIN